MVHKIAVASIFALLLAATPSSGSMPEPVPDEARAGMCADFSGLAFGFCVALCEARQCDLQPPSDQRCAVLRRGFEHTTGGLEPPC